jgi:hypothetical protein
MATEYILGASASCSDGHCGEVIRAILDPAARTVTHLVVEPRHRPADGRLVPVAMIDAGADEIGLRCTLAEFNRLDASEEIEFVEGMDYGGGYGSPDAVQGFGNVGAGGVGASSSGGSIGGSLGHHPATVSTDAVPEGESEVSADERIHATDGEVGRLKGFAVDSADHKVTYVLLSAGHLWGHKDLAIPISAVASLDDGVWLNITKKQVQDLPPRT